MSIVEGIGPRTRDLLRSRPRRAGEAHFTLDTPAPPARTGAAEATMPAVAAGMLALQEAAIESPPDRAARRHGRTMLSALSRLQCALLDATDSEAALDELAMLAGDMPCATNPGLAAALHAVVLRARVELARRGR